MKRIFRQLLADEEGTFDIETGQQPRTGFAYAPTATALLKADEPTRYAQPSHEPGERAHAISVPGATQAAL